MKLGCLSAKFSSSASFNLRIFAIKVPLSAVVLQVLHEKICTKMLKGYPWDRTTHTMLCAGGEDKVSSY